VRRCCGVTAALVSATLLIGGAAWGIAAFNAGGQPSDAVQQAASNTIAAGADPIIDPVFGPTQVYQTTEDGTLRPAPGGIPGQVWAALMRMATPEFVADHLGGLRVLDVPELDLIARVERGVGDARWTLIVNLARISDRATYLRTLLHEYWHLVTLDLGQFDSSAAECETIRLLGGCLRADALLERFFARFWAGYGPSAPAPDSTDAAVGWRLYVRHTADFVSSYAATNAAEDLAETFAEFVIRDRPDERSGTWAQKILFLWDDPEAVAFRDRVRDWFVDELPPPLPIRDWQH